MALISDWAQAWKFFSVQANAVGISACFMYLTMYEKMEKILPPKYMVAITLCVFVLGIIGRVTAQNLSSDKPIQE